MFLMCSSVLRVDGWTSFSISALQVPVDLIGYIVANRFAVLSFDRDQSSRSERDRRRERLRWRFRCAVARRGRM